jgi:hypothetical protein
VILLINYIFGMSIRIMLLLGIIFGSFIIAGTIAFTIDRNKDRKDKVK